MDKKQTLKHSIESLLRLLENKEVVETTDQHKVVLESCADAEMFPCDEETCEVPGNADLPNTFAMHEGKVVQCLPLDYLGVIKAKGEKRSILDRSTDVLRKLHEVAIPQMQKMLSHRQRMTCGAYDTRRNDDHDRGMCNAAVDLGGHRRCFWDPLADQRCQHSVKSLADELERLRAHMDNLSKAVQDGDFRDFVTGLVEKHKNEWRATFTQWQRIKVEFQERAFWFEKSLGKQEICRVHNRDQATCEGSGMCEFTDEGVCRVTPEEQKNGPVWVADQNGGTVPVVSDEFPHYLAGYRSIFREYRIDDEYEVGQTMERMQGGALALSLKLRREKLWTLEVKNGQKNYNELVQKLKQLEVAQFDLDADKDVIQDAKKKLQRALGDENIDSLQTFRTKMLTEKSEIDKVMEERHIINSWDPPETTTPTVPSKSPSEQRIEQITLQHTIQLKTKIMARKQHEQMEVQEQLEAAEKLFAASCGKMLNGGGDDPDCTALKREVTRLKEKKNQLSRFIQTIQRQQHDSAKAIVQSREEQEKEESNYNLVYGNPPPPVPVEAFKAAGPWHTSLVEWEPDTILLYRTAPLDNKVMAYELKYHTCNLVLEFFAMYVEVVNLLKTKDESKALLVVLDLQQLRGKLAALQDTEGLMQKEFGMERPAWLQKGSTILPPFYVDENEAYELNDENGEWATHNFDPLEWTAAKTIGERYMNQDGMFSWMFKTPPPTLVERHRLKNMLETANVRFPKEFTRHVAVEEPLFHFRQQHTLAETSPDDDQLVALQPTLMATHLSDTQSSQVWKGVVQDTTKTTNVNGNSRRLILVRLTERKGQNEEWVNVDDQKDPILVDMDSIQESNSNVWPPASGDRVTVLTSVYVEQFVTPVRARHKDELLPWVSVQQKYREKRTNAWFDAIGPYINPNVSMYDKKELDVAFCKQLRTTDDWFDLYTSEDIEDHKKLLRLANRPQPNEFKTVGGWKPNSLWMHTLHGNGASVKNVYAHHLKPASKKSAGWMAEYFTTSTTFEGTPFPQGTLVRRKNSNEVYMIDSGLTEINESDMYKQLHPTNQSLKSLTVVDMEHDGKWYKNVPRYECVSFQRTFQFCTAKSVVEDNVTFECNDGTRVNRSITNIKVGEKKSMPFYEKIKDVQLSHFELEQVPVFHRGDRVLYTKSPNNAQAHGEIESVLKELSMVTIQGTSLFVGFEDLQKTNDAFVFNLGNTVAIQHPVEEVLIGQTIEFQPLLGGFDDKECLTMFEVTNVNLGQRYTIQSTNGGEPMTVLENNLVFFDSLDQKSNNPVYRPEFKVNDRLFVKEGGLPETSTTDDVVLEQWKETRDVEVIRVYPLHDQSTFKDPFSAKDITFRGYRVKPLNAKVPPFNVEEGNLTTDEPKKLGRNDVVEVRSEKPLTLTTWGTSGLYTKTVKVGNWKATVQGRREFPTCHDEAQREIEASNMYFAKIYELAQGYTALEQQQKSTQENEDMFGDLEDVSVVHRKSFLAGGDGRTLEDIENEAKNLPRPSLARSACQTVPEYISPDEKNILFSVHQWGKDVFEPPLNVYNDKTYTVKQGQIDVSEKYPNLMMPTWNLVYFNWSFWASNRVLFPQTSSDQSDWLQAGEWSKEKTRLIGRIEETQDDRYRVRFQCFPKGDWTNPSSYIIVSCWVKKEFLDRIDYAKEHYESRRYFSSVWKDTSDVPSFAVAGWTNQQSKTLKLDGVPIQSPHTDSRVPWMLKTMAFQRPWNEQVRMVETVLKNDTWRNAFLTAILQFQQKKEVNDLTWEGTAASALESWMKMARRVKDLNNDNAPDNVLFMKNGVPLDLDLVPLEWFYQDAYPMRKIFYELNEN